MFFEFLLLNMYSNPNVSINRIHWILFTTSNPNFQHVIAVNNLMKRICVWKTGTRCDGYSHWAEPWQGQGPGLGQEQWGQYVPTPVPISCNVKASTQYHTTCLFPVPVIVRLLAYLHCRTRTRIPTWIQTPNPMVPLYCTETVSIAWTQTDSGWPHSRQDKIPCVFPVLDSFSLCYFHVINNS